MMLVHDVSRYERHRTARTTGSTAARMIHELFLPALLFASMGAITWAIRGTNGWDGIDGTILPGMTWGLIWYFVCWRKGIDARGLILWLGLGMALGGELGYGQYVSWIQGIFRMESKITSISPWIGYVWFAICGIGWAAPGGILLGWALGETASPVRGVGRVVLLLILFVLLLGEPFIDWARPHFARSCPELLFPHSNQGIYAGELDKHLARTVYTNTQNFLVLLWWGAAMLIAAFQRDRYTLVTGGIVGAGFGLGFAQSAMWCLGYSYAPDFVDWWKMWELNAGFNLGLLYAIALYWATRKMDKSYQSEGKSRDATRMRTPLSVPAERGRSMFSILFVCATLFLAFLEYAWVTGAFLCLSYAATMGCGTWKNRGSDPAVSEERTKYVLVVYSVFLLLFVLFHGATSRGGVVLGLYSAGDVGQYQWPTARLALFVPIALLLTGTASCCMARILRGEGLMNQSALEGKRLPVYMVDLMAVIGFVGALSIWPDKVGIMYPLFLCIALAAFMRLNRRFDEIEGA